MAFQFMFLTEQFFIDYSHCPEIEQKRDRPYVRILVRIDNIDFAVPMRSHIKHPNAFITDPENRCGIDYSKAVIMTDPVLYIDANRKPHIRQKEFDALRGKEYVVEQGMRRYLKLYIKAKQRPDAKHNALLLKYSTLQYFDDLIPPMTK